MEAVKEKKPTESSEEHKLSCSVKGTADMRSISGCTSPTIVKNGRCCAAIAEVCPEKPTGAQKKPGSDKEPLHP